MSLVHLHLMLNHVPMAGIVFAGILLAIAVAWRHVALERVALAFMLASALLTVPVYLTGEPAEELAERLPGVREAAIDRHEDAAEASLVAAGVLGGIALLGLAATALPTRRVLARTFAVALLGLTVITTGLFGWTGYLGGQIRHTELRTASASTAPADAEEPRPRARRSSRREGHER